MSFLDRAPSSPTPDSGGFSYEAPKRSIELPENDAHILEVLKPKLDEYKERARAQKIKLEPFGAILDTEYKIAILEQLITEGKVIALEVEEKLKKADDNVFFRGLFDNAFAVIGEYAKDDGTPKKIFGGTGPFTQHINT